MSFGKNSEKVGQMIDERAPLLSRNGEGYKVELEKFKGASFAGSVFNLSCSIVGAGIMSLPSLFKLLGVVPGIALVMVAAFLSETSIEMLLRFSKPCSAFSYSDVMGDAFGTTGRVLLQICVIVNNIGAVIIYLIITEDVISGSNSSGIHHAGILEGWFGEHWWTGRAFVLLVLTTVVFIPLICFRRIDSLRFTSAISFALAVLFIVVLIGITLYKLIEGSIKTPKWFPSVDDTSSSLNLFTAVPVLVCAYLCHFNVHTIENELGESPRMQAVVQTTLALCAMVYAMTGLFGFLLFGDSTLSDVLSNFDANLAVPYSKAFCLTQLEVLINKHGTTTCISLRSNVHTQYLDSVRVYWRNGWSYASIHISCCHHSQGLSFYSNEERQVFVHCFDHPCAVLECSGHIQQCKFFVPQLVQLRLMPVHAVTTRQRREAFRTCNLRAI